MKISIIIPCFNEEQTLEKIVKKVLKFQSFEKEIIIVDDCSSDRSGEIIDNLKTNFSEIKSVKHKKNLGKGAGIKSGVEPGGCTITISFSDKAFLRSVSGGGRTPSAVRGG